MEIDGLSFDSPEQLREYLKKAFEYLAETREVESDYAIAYNAATEAYELAASKLPEKANLDKAAVNRKIAQVNQTQQYEHVRNLVSALAEWTKTKGKIVPGAMAKTTENVNIVDHKVLTLWAVQQEQKIIEHAQKHEFDYSPVYVELSKKPINDEAKVAIEKVRKGIPTDFPVDAVELRTTYSAAIDKDLSAYLISGEPPF